MYTFLENLSNGAALWGKNSGMHILCRKAGLKNVNLAESKRP